jgi:hypothetical protein
LKRRDAARCPGDGAAANRRVEKRVALIRHNAPSA